METNRPPQHHRDSREQKPELERGLSTASALGLNVIDMVGVGPFVTLPLIVSAMGGPQAILGWLIGALLSLCDGLVWSELGTAYPEAGGSYAYLKHLYGPRGGRALSFLYAWQLLISAPLSIASGCIGFSQYLSFFFPNAAHPFASTHLFSVPIVLSAQTLIAMSACAVALIVLYRSILVIDRIARWLGILVGATLVFVIVAGFTHFQPSLAFDFPAGAFHLNGSFLLGLGSGMLISAYDYWGYYNVCFLGAEVRDPQRTIPRAVLGAIAIVGTLYMLMNVSVLGVLPWREMISDSADSHARMFTIAVFMERLYGHFAAAVIVVLISLAALSSVFALLLGYSRIPFAAARDGNFPAWFGAVHAKHRIPHHALLTLGAITLACCIFRLQEVITTLVVIRILFQFLLQGIAVLLPKHRRERQQRGFRMPLYPLPALLAMTAFLFILISRPNYLREMRTAGVVLLFGIVVFLARQLAAKRKAAN